MKKIFCLFGISVILSLSYFPIVNASPKGDSINEISVHQSQLQTENLDDFNTTKKENSGGI